MNISILIGEYHFIDGILSSPSVDFKLAIAPNRSQKPTAPTYQLIFRKKGHKDHNKRLSGLFVVDGNTFRGDIVVDGIKNTFYLHLDKSKELATLKAVGTNDTK